jgi:hypothetical protein
MKVDGLDYHPRATSYQLRDLQWEISLFLSHFLSVKWKL